MPTHFLVQSLLKTPHPSPHLIGHHSGDQIYPNIGYFVILWSWMDSQIKLDKNIWDSQIKLDKHILTFFADFGQWDSNTAMGPPKAQARPDPGQIWDIWEPGNPEVWNPMEPLRQTFQNFGPTATLASKISEFWTYWSPCVKDFRILNLLEPLRQRFQNFEPSGAICNSGIWNPEC